MWIRLAIALGAGLASALLFIVTVQGTMMAVALAYLAPLPIMIAVLGWGIDVGAIAMVAACALVAGAIEPFFGLLFALTVALPGWALASFAHLRDLRFVHRPNDPEPPVRASVGMLVIAAAAIGIAVSVGALIWMMVVSGGYEKGVAAFSEMLRPAIEDALGGPLRLPEDLTFNDLAGLIVKYSPAAIAGSMTLMFIINLYAAARSAQTSLRLNRPWPDVPTSLVVPPAVVGVALAALATWLVAPEPASLFAAVFVGAFGVVYVLQGLAVLHALSRRVQGRPVLIAALYLACIVAPRWVLPALAMIGLIESFVAMRARAAARPFRP
jgi:hypothetical protein